MKRILLIIFINILVFSVLLGIIEASIYLHHKKYTFEDTSFGYSFINPPQNNDDLEYFFNGSNEYGYGRVPDGTEYKSDPIIIFGCSFAYGMELNKDQTIGYKLSHILKRPVYNRSVYGQALSEMYYQSESEEFYKQVPKSDTVIYIMIDDHYRRMFTDTCEVIDTWFLVQYDIKKGKLIRRKYKNIFSNFIKSLYLVKQIKHSYFAKYTTDEKNKEKLTDDALIYFIKTRENLEKRWNNKIKFTVIFYNDILGSDLLKEKLLKNQFYVIDIKDLTNENLYDDKYLAVDKIHPSEAAWDLLTPLIAEIIEKQR